MLTISILVAAYESVFKMLNFFLKLCGISSRYSGILIAERPSILIAERLFHGRAYFSSFCSRNYTVSYCTSYPSFLSKDLTKHLPKPVRFSSVKSAPGIHENVSSLHIKKRPQKKKRPLSVDETLSEPGHWEVVAYTTADEFNLEKMISSMRRQELYDVTPVDPTSEVNVKGSGLELDVIHASARYSVGSEPREFFIFREGTIVLWNMDDLECSNLLTFLRSFEENSYDELLVQSESDVMPYSYTDTRESGIANGVMLLKSGDSILLDKYTFSNAMALSVKLGAWEASLDRYVDSIEDVTEVRT